MTTVADANTLEKLVQRLEKVTPDSPRQWGTMTVGEMLCHLGDAADSVRNREGDETPPKHRIMKFIALYAPLQWPRERLPTPAEVDPKRDGTKPTDFEADRRRAIEGLRAVAGASADELLPGHGAFGPMNLKDWHRWAYRHTDHHLRQFGG